MPIAKLRNQPTAIEIFTGAGGLSLGLERAGFNVLAGVEKDPIHACTHLYNFPATPMVCKDVCKVPVQELEPFVVSCARGELDLLAGSPSCQGFSVGGLNDKFDPRNSLMLEMARLAEGLKPKYVLIENVPPMFNSKEYFLFLGQMRDAGYLPEFSDVLNAQYYAVPQSRKRAIVIMKRIDLAELAPISSIPGITEFGSYSVADAIGNLPQLQDAPAGRDKVEAWSVEPNDIESDCTIPNRERRRPHPANMTYSGFSCASHTMKTLARFKCVEPGSRDKVSRRHRLHWRRVSPTLRAGTDSERGSFTAILPIHPVLDRAINVREAARIQTFPDWFCFHDCRSHAARQIGNAVPPMLAHAISHEISSRLITERTEFNTKQLSRKAGHKTRLLGFSPMDAAVFWGYGRDDRPIKTRSAARAIRRLKERVERNGGVMVG